MVNLLCNAACDLDAGFHSKRCARILLRPAESPPAESPPAESPPAESPSFAGSPSNTQNFTCSDPPVVLASWLVACCAAGLHGLSASSLGCQAASCWLVACCIAGLHGWSASSLGCQAASCWLVACCTAGLHGWSASSLGWLFAALLGCMDCQLAHLAGWLLAALLGCMDCQLAHSGCFMLAGCLLRCWAAWLGVLLHAASGAASIPALTALWSRWILLQVNNLRSSSLGCRLCCWLGCRLGCRLCRRL